MDRGGVLASAAQAQEGRIFPAARVARVHTPDDPLRYSWGAEHRDRAELERIVAQLPGKPVVTHPEAIAQHPDDLISRGAAHKVIGKILSARVDGDFAVAEVLITDPETIAAIDTGIKELSLGYACRADADGYQRDTYVDHLAVVRQGRCTGAGGTCALHADRVEDAATPGEAPTRADGACGCQGASERRLQTDASDVPCACNPHAVNTEGNVSDNAHQDDRLTAAQRHALPSHMFADPAHQGLPLENENHVRDAMARFNQEQFSGPAARKAAFHRIVARAHELGIDPSGFVKKYGGRLDNEDTMDLQQELDTAKAEITALKAKLDTAEQAVKDAIAAKDAAELAKREADKDAKAAQGRIDAAEAKAAEAEKAAQVRTDAAFDARVAQRVDVLANANAVLGTQDAEGKSLEHAKKSDLDLMKEIAVHVDGADAVLESDGEAEVRVAYRGALKRHAAAANSHAAVRAATFQNRQAAENAARADAADTEDAAFAAMNASLRRTSR